MSFGYKALPQSSSYDFISNANLNVNEAGSRPEEGTANGITSAANNSRLRRAQSRGVEQGQLHQVLRRFRKRQQNLHHDSKEYFCRREKEVQEPLRAQSNPTLTWLGFSGIKYSDNVLARIKMASFFYAMVYLQLGTTELHGWMERHAWSSSPRTLFTQQETYISHSLWTPRIPQLSDNPFFLFVVDSVRFMRFLCMD